MNDADHDARVHHAAGEHRRYAAKVIASGKQHEAAGLGRSARRLARLVETMPTNGTMTTAQHDEPATTPLRAAPATAARRARRRPAPAGRRRSSAVIARYTPASPKTWASLLAPSTSTTPTTPLTRPTAARHAPVAAEDAVVVDVGVEHLAGVQADRLLLQDDLLEADGQRVAEPQDQQQDDDAAQARQGDVPQLPPAGRRRRRRPPRTARGRSATARPGTGSSPSRRPSRSPGGDQRHEDVGRCR